MGSIAHAITEMGLELYNELNKNATNQSIFFSPVNILTGLTIVFLGARGNTAAQMQKVLHLTSAAESENLRPGSASENVMAEAEPEYLSEGKHQLPCFSKQYLECAKELYGATLQTVNFGNATEAASQTINLLVERQTQGKIRELFAPGAIDATAVLVLVNAVYFRATWAYKFEEKHTMAREFWINQNEKKSVQMMYQKGTFKTAHIQEMNAQILAIPYTGKSLNMIILLPDDITGLEQVERAMTYENLAQWTLFESIREKEVEVYLPRFKLEDSFELNFPLQELGMTDVFEKSTADLFGMASPQRLFLSLVVHKAYVEVNEEGTSAAAATGGIAVDKAYASPFMADHPFLFFIQHSHTNTILFFGKLCSP